MTAFDHHPPSSKGIRSGGAAGQGSGRHILAKGVLPVVSDTSLNAATLPLRPSQFGRPPPPVARGRVGAGLVAAGVIAGSALVGVFCARGGVRPGASSGVVAAPPATAVAQRPFVSLALRTTAPNAHFRFEDGREVANPYVGLVARSERPQSVWVEANGFLPKKIAVVLTDDVTVDDIHLVSIGDDPVRPPARRPGEHNLPTPRAAPRR
jgi:hypothetical protein